VDYKQRLLFPMKTRYRFYTVTSILHLQINNKMIRTVFYKSNTNIRKK